MCPFLPDSPRLLIRKGKHEEALDVLAALEGHGATPDSPVVITQYNIIKDILDREHLTTYTWWQLLSGKGPSGVLRRMLLGAYMQVMNQISGINVTSYYMSYIFINALGISELLSRILAAAGSVDYLIFACLAYFVIERYGRRKVSKQHIQARFKLSCSGYDGVCRSMFIVLDHDRNLSGTYRGGRRFIQTRNCRRLFLLRLLR